MMDVFSAISNRKSIRAYKNQEIEEEKLNKVLEAARLSPSASNKQEWKFVVVKDKNKIAKLTDATNGYKFIGQAPVVIVACGTDQERVMPCGQNAYTVDLSIATAYMILEAYELGLGTCWIGGFSEDKVKEALGIPANVRVVSMFPLGYADGAPVIRPRKTFDEVVCVDEYK